MSVFMFGIRSEPSAFDIQTVYLTFFDPMEVRIHFVCALTKLHPMGPKKAIFKKKKKTELNYIQLKSKYRQSILITFKHVEI